MPDDTNAARSMMKTPLVTSNGYRVFHLLIPIELPTVARHPSIAYLGGTYNPPAAGQLMNDSSRLPHYPYTRVRDSAQAVIANPEHRGGCRPVLAVRSEYGGGYVEDGPGWLTTGEPLAWIHDGRFHDGHCPEAAQ